MNKKVSISICTYNNYNYLFFCLESLIAQHANKDDYEVIVLDNTPSSVIKELNRNNPSFYLYYKKCIGLCKQNDFKYIEKHTDGLSGARNECINESCADFIHFIDDDTILHENFIRESIDCFSRHPDLAIFGGKVIPDWRFSDPPEWFYDELLGFLSMIDFGDKEKVFGEGFWHLVGANLCFKKSTLIDYGGFDLSLGRKGGSKGLLGAEENQLVWDIQKNHKVLYNPHVSLSHIIQKDRINQSWFIKRVAWQSVCDVMTGTPWPEEYDNSFVSSNLDLLLSECLDKKSFKLKIELVKQLSFGLLNEGLKC